MAVPWVAIAKGVTTGVLTGVSSLLNSSAMRKTLRLAAETNRTQARMALERANIMRSYANEELGQQTWNLQEQSEIFRGAQNAAIGGSGFNDVTTGDQVLMKDTIRRTGSAMEGLNRSAYLNSFETDKAALMESAYYNAQANIADRTRQILYNKKTSWMRAWWQGSAAGSNAFLDSFSFGAGGKATDNISPTLPLAPAANSGTKGMGKLDYSFSTTNSLGNSFASQFVNF